MGIVLPTLQIKKLKQGDKNWLVAFSDLQLCSNQLPPFALDLQSFDLPSALGEWQVQHRGNAVQNTESFSESTDLGVPAVAVWDNAGHAPLGGHNSWADLDSGKHFPETSNAFSK